MLLGREDERERIAALLRGAVEDGRSEALLLHGEAGIGKSALLVDAVDRAKELGFQVLRTRGYESESDIPFAGLLDLLTPLLHLRDRIPEVQARALGSALALEPPTPYDRFAVPAGMLSLLAAAAEEQPLLAVIDDVHWLDEGSREAAMFVGRRLGNEGIVVLGAARVADYGVTDFDVTGVETLRVRPLPQEAAKELLRTQQVADVVAEELVRTAGGNPLALLEMPNLLTPAQRAGREALAAVPPPGTTVERAFRQQLAALPETARRAALVAASMGTGRLDVLLSALQSLGLGADELGEAEALRVLEVSDGRVDFRHPLLRATLYHAATDNERRQVHAVLADVAPDARRRAWHLAIAAIEPDEAVAAELEAAARDARERGGAAEAARAFARAGELSVDPAARVRRDMEGAIDYASAGQNDRALALLDDADGLVEDSLLRADLQRTRAFVELRRGGTEVAYSVLTAEAERIRDEDPGRAAGMLVEACAAQMLAGQLAEMQETSTKARALAAQTGVDLLVAYAELIAGEALLGLTKHAEGDALVAAALPRVLAEEVPPAAVEIVAMAAHSGIWLEDFARAEQVTERLVSDARRASAIGRLPYPLSVRADLELRRGRWTRAYADAEEAVRLSRDTRQVGLLGYSAAVLVHVEAALGHTAEAQQLGAEALEVTAMLGAAAPRIYLLAAIAFDDHSQGRNEQAIERFSESLRLAVEHQMDPGYALFAGDHVEALVRAGRTQEAEEVLARIEARAEVSAGTFDAAAAARARGLLAPSDGFDEHFERALELHGRELPFEVARTQLAWGERLRRDRRRAQSREPLTAALQTFERLGAEPWAERARAELRSTGGPHREAVESAVAEQLTAHELQIGLLVAQGMTNREVAASLFLSPKTIEYHLGQIYRKLDIRSRTQLARLLASELPESAQAGAA